MWFTLQLPWSVSDPGELGGVETEPSRLCFSDTQGNAQHDISNCNRHVNISSSQYPNPQQHDFSFADVRGHTEMGFSLPQGVKSSDSTLLTSSDRMQHMHPVNSAPMPVVPGYPSHMYPHGEVLPPPGMPAVQHSQVLQFPPQISTAQQLPHPSGYPPQQDPNLAVPAAAKMNSSYQNSSSFNAADNQEIERDSAGTGDIQPAEGTKATNKILGGKVYERRNKKKRPANYYHNYTDGSEVSSTGQAAPVPDESNSNSPSHKEISAGNKEELVPDVTNRETVDLHMAQLRVDPNTKYVNSGDNQSDSNIQTLGQTVSPSDGLLRSELPSSAFVNSQSPPPSNPQMSAEVLSVHNASYTQSIGGLSDETCDINFGTVTASMVMHHQGRSEAHVLPPQQTQAFISAGPDNALEGLVASEVDYTGQTVQHPASINPTEGDVVTTREVATGSACPPELPRTITDGNQPVGSLVVVTSSTMDAMSSSSPQVSSPSLSNDIPSTASINQSGTSTEPVAVPPQAQPAPSKPKQSSWAGLFHGTSSASVATVIYNNTPAAAQQTNSPVMSEDPPTIVPATDDVNGRLLAGK